MSALRGFVFDIDGCLMKGARPLSGAPEAVTTLKSRSMAVRYFTNDSSKTPEDIATRLERAGIPATAEEVLTSGLVAAEYAARRFPGGRLLPIGGAALREALERRGLRVVEEWPADAVLVGRDLDLSYRKLEAACKAIWKGAAFLATNMDRRMPVEDGYVPGTGSVAKAVAWATDRSPTVMGKPSAHAGRAALRSLGLPPRDVAIVGDQLEQDIRMGRLSGTTTVLVLTGSSTRADVERMPPRFRPDAVLMDAGQLIAWLDRVAAEQGG
ncbi:MAG TPA: HAD-IIA family hydrolase, partial [Coriobacteriia bacterium]